MIRYDLEKLDKDIVNIVNGRAAEYKEKILDEDKKRKFNVETTEMIRFFLGERPEASHYIRYYWDLIK